MKQNQMQGRNAIIKIINIFWFGQITDQSLLSWDNSNTTFKSSSSYNKNFIIELPIGHHFMTILVPKRLSFLTLSKIPRMSQNALTCQAILTTPVIPRVCSHFCHNKLINQLCWLKVCSWQFFLGSINFTPSRKASRYADHKYWWDYKVNSILVVCGYGYKLVQPLWKTLQQYLCKSYTNSCLCQNYTLKSTF